jgi:hypothetical protein
MKKHLISMAATVILLTACGGAKKTNTAEADNFKYTVEQFADLQILRYRVPGFENLTLKQKELVYYLRSKEEISCSIRTENTILPSGGCLRRSIRIMRVTETARTL